MKKHKSKIGTIIKATFIVALAAFTLSSCSLSYSINHYDIDEFSKCAIGYSKRNAFIGYVTYNLDTKEIHLPSEFRGVKIEDLGGYYGKGVPTPFFLEYAGIEHGFITGFDEINEEDTIIETNIDIYLPKYLKSRSYIDEYVTGFREKGKEPATIYIARCNYYIDSENEYFYTKNGKLFNRSDDSVVDNLIYQNDN